MSPCILWSASFLLARKINFEGGLVLRVENGAIIVPEDRLALKGLPNACTELVKL